MAARCSWWGITCGHVRDDGKKQTWVVGNAPLDWSCDTNWVCKPPAPPPANELTDMTTDKSTLTYKPDMVPEECTGDAWAGKACQTVCANPLNAHSCRIGYLNYCGTGSRWKPPAYGGDETCWTYGRLTQPDEIHRRFKETCSKTIDDPMCYGPDSFVCSTNRNDGEELKPGHRYGWCMETAQRLCEADGFKHKRCSCLVPLTKSEQMAITRIGVPADRYCIATELGGLDLHLTCRNEGIQPLPGTVCPNVCINYNAAVNDSLATQENVTVICDPNGGSPPQTISVPGSRQSVADWDKWWGKREWVVFGRDTAIPLSKVIDQFLISVGNSSFPSELYSVRNTLVKEFASKTDAFAQASKGIDARLALLTMPKAGASATDWLAWLDINVGKFSDATTPSITDVITSSVSVIRFATPEQRMHYEAIAQSVESIPARNVIRRALGELDKIILPPPVENVESVQQTIALTSHTAGVAAAVIVIAIVLYIATVM